MKFGESQQQKHPPGKAHAEVASAASCVAKLYEEAEAEQKRECGIGLSGKDEIDDLDDLGVKPLQPFRSLHWSVKYVVVFKIV